MTNEKKTAADIILKLRDFFQNYGTPEDLAEIDKILMDKRPLWVPLGDLERATMIFFLLEQSNLCARAEGLLYEKEVKHENR
jgi:hypothetical protein